MSGQELIAKLCVERDDLIKALRKCAVLIPGEAAIRNARVLLVKIEANKSPVV